MTEFLQRTKRAADSIARQDKGLRWVALAVVLIGLALFNHIIGFPIVGAHAPFWRAPHNDMAAMLAGQEAVFRHPWRFPLVATNRLLSPADLSTVYTDSIPWLTIGLKATGLWKALNGLGLFFMITYALQPLAMLALLRACGVRQIVLQVLGALLALLLPAWLMRHGHVALTGHFLIILALAVSVESARTGLTLRKSLAFAGLAVLAMGVHAYHLPPIGLCFAAAMASEIAQRRPKAWVNSAIASAMVLGGMAVAAVLLGYGIGQGESGGKSPIGFYSMNILAPLIPQGSSLFGQTFQGGWFAQTLDPNGGQWFEGYNYLGAGVLLTIVAGALLSVRHGWLPTPVREWSRRWLPLTLAMVVLTLWAIGPNPYLAQRLLFTGPKLAGVFEWLSLFRAHGRFFWSVAYLLIAVSIVQIGRYARPNTLLAIAVAALALQWADSHEMRAGVRHTFSESAPSFHPVDLEKAPVLKNRPWVFAPIFFCAADKIDQMEIAQLTLVAVRNGGSSNGASTARGQGSSCTTPEDAFAVAGPNDPRITVVMEGSAGADYARFTQRADCRRFLRGLICGRGVETIPGLTKIAPYVPNGSRIVAQVDFDKGVNPPELVSGWASADPTGIWSSDPVATMTVKVPNAAAGAPLILELHALSFTLPPDVMQTVHVSVEGRELATWNVEKGNWRPYRASVPAELIKPGEPLTVQFTVGKPKPRTADDPRALGLGVQKLVISQ
ncbi:hypothetical protein [Caulobacter sp. 1776]|uniref:hypothetical protein n=1 Tax=Caulobacter sp. 1776 TaxID=3156420 RepID=UPI0033929B8B